MAAMWLLNLLIFSHSPNHVSSLHHWWCLVSFFVGVDCGVFTCMFCDFISNDCSLVFNQDHINKCRDRIAISIMKNCAIE